MASKSLSWELINVMTTTLHSMYVFVCVGNTWTDNITSRHIHIMTNHCQPIHIQNILVIHNCISQTLWITWDQIRSLPCAVPTHCSALLADHQLLKKSFNKFSNTYNYDNVIGIGLAMIGLTLLTLVERLTRLPVRHHSQIVSGKQNNKLLYRTSDKIRFIQL